MAGMRTHLLASLLLGLVTASASAAIPDHLSVQGRLATSGGAPITDPTTVTIRIHPDSGSGFVDFAETDVVVPDASGVFSTVIGDGAVLNPALFDQERWVSFEIDGGGELAPRVPLKPAPAALRAQAAAALVPTTTVDLGGELLTGIAAPSSPPDAANKAYVDAGDATQAASVAAVSAATSAHAADGDIHFTQGSISIFASQVSDFDSKVSVSTHGSASGIHFTQASISITASQVSDFDAAVDGSSHAGDTGNPHAVTKTQVGLRDVENILDEYDGGRRPLAGDDALDGYDVGSHWVDRGSATQYVLATGTGFGNAVWRATNAGRNVVQAVPTFSGGAIDPVASGLALENLLFDIQDASATNPYVLRIAPGTYQLSGAWSLKSHVTLEGAGMEATTILLGGTVAAAPATVVRDLEFAVEPSSGAGLVLDSGEDVLLERVAFTGSGISAASHHAIHVTTGTPTLRIRNSRFQLAGTGAGVLSAVRNEATAEGGTTEVHGSRVLLTMPGGGATGVFVAGGTARVRDSEIEIAAGADSSGVRTEGATTPVVRVEACEIGVHVTSGTGWGVFARGVDGAFLGNVLGMTGGGLVGIDAGTEDAIVADNRLELAGSGQVQGIFAPVGGRNQSAGGNVVDATTTGTEGLNGIELRGERVAVTGNTVNVDAGTSTSTTYGIYLQPTIQGAASGNTIEILAASAGTLRGLGSFGQRTSLTGITIRGERTSGFGGLTGIHMGTAGTLSSCFVRVENSAGTTIGIQGAGRISSSEIEVDGNSTSYGILTIAGDLSVGTTSVDVSGLASIVRGIEAADSFFGSGLDISVHQDHPTASVAGLAVGGAAQHRAILTGSRVVVTTSGSTTPSVADISDGISSPDLYMSDCHNSAGTLGTDVVCTDSTCF